MRFPRFTLPLIFALSTSSLSAAQTLSVVDLTEGMTTTIQIEGCGAGERVQLAYSLAGVGPISTSYGQVDLSHPIVTPPVLTADSQGVAALQASVPQGSGGLAVWFHAVNLTTAQLTNSLAEVIASAPAGMVLVPAGQFVMGDHAGIGQADELPLHTVALDGFWMDACEVTTQAYVDFLNTAHSLGEVVVQQGVVYGAPNGKLYCDTFVSNYDSRIEWNGSVFSSARGKKNHPMLKVSWYGSCAFSNWRSLQEGLLPCYDLNTWVCDFSANGFRLATEAEWEYAARGGESQYQLYPWGSTLSGSYANFFASGDPYELTWPSTTPVGYYDGGQFPSGSDMANGFGLYDMAGNLYEWCNDWYDASYYAQSPSNNPFGPNAGTYRILRGGSWNSTAPYLRNALRGGDGPERRNSYVGFRCVCK
ncbi:MAG: SUMF1/EgtB/PvdO family nonheme iron enzyme [Planctomycetes bacterium]|nr:SUMF1/EgtB/PvdO family nonheme iron enzyme [Planctomycetota bacterium]MBT4029576.1 SUMF1/EgtB/PvdO family nonheme iron enzyme [Planctomycetota bacterium]MBT4560554.1 SUMF1/EgtB/PvdO family nonheme iron enzyme [Planctomycetota bacterium]MBT5101585.1 SUMF1/EgtB/PvdO family nonheme iron enzyme [Planctomycetota bacterium]MBT7012025.1 SUMF1/EgtB/PvdO family nonheme iron enzyme [Planctomycetota bacterium]